MGRISGTIVTIITLLSTWGLAPFAKIARKPINKIKPIKNQFERILKNKIFRRSIFAIKDIKKGEKFLVSNIKTYRPNLGLGENYYFDLINKKSPININKNQPLSKNLLKLLKKRK